MSCRQQQTFFAARSKVGRLERNERREFNWNEATAAVRNAHGFLRSTCANELRKTGFYALSTPWNGDPSEQRSEQKIEQSIYLMLILFHREEDRDGDTCNFNTVYSQLYHCAPLIDGSKFSSGGSGCLCRILGDWVQMKFDLRRHWSSMGSFPSHNRSLKI